MRKICRDENVNVNQEKTQRAEVVFTGDVLKIRGITPKSTFEVSEYLVYFFCLQLWYELMSKFSSQ